MNTVTQETGIEDDFMDDLLNDNYDIIDNSDPDFINCDIIIKQPYSHYDAGITDAEFKVAAYRANNKYDEYANTLIIEREGVSNENAQIFITANSIRIVKMPDSENVSDLYSFVRAMVELTHFLRLTNVILTCNHVSFPEIYIKLLNRRGISISEQSSRFPGCYLDGLNQHRRTLECESVLLRNSVRGWRNAFIVTATLLTITVGGIAISTALETNQHGNAKGEVTLAPLPDGFK